MNQPESKQKLWMAKAARMNPPWDWILPTSCCICHAEQLNEFEERDYAVPVNVDVFEKYPQLSDLMALEIQVRHTKKNAQTGHWFFISNGFTLEFESVKIWKSTPLAKRMQQHAQQGETIKASLLAYLHPGSDDTWFHVRRRVKCCGPNCFTSPMFDGCDQTNTKSVLHLLGCMFILLKPSNSLDGTKPAME